MSLTKVGLHLKPHTHLPVWLTGWLSLSDLWLLHIFIVKLIIKIMNLFSLDLVQYYDILLMKVLCTTHWRAEHLKSLKVAAN